MKLQVKDKSELDQSVMLFTLKSIQKVLAPVVQSWLRHMSSPALKYEKLWKKEWRSKVILWTLSSGEESD